ncbi:MAG TPA: MFS transporter [Novosphingobium sp.]
MKGSFAIGWRQVASAFVLLACVATVTSSFSVVAVPLAAEFKPSRAVLALAMTVISGTSALIAPFLGGMMDRTSVRRMMLIGSALLGAGYVAITLAQSFTQVLLAYALLIAPSNVLLGPVAATVLLSRWFVRRRGAALGFAIAGIAMGGIVFPPIIQGFLGAFSWREGLRIFAVLIFALSTVAAALVVDHPAQKGLRPDGEAIDPAAPPAPAARPPLRASAILGDPAFWLIVLMLTVVTSGMKGMVTSLAPMAIDQGVKPATAAYLISIYASCGFVSKLVFAAIADRMNPRVLAVTSLAGFGAGMLILTQAHLGFGLIAAGVGVVGLFGGMMIPLESMLGARVFGREAVGRAVGLLSMVSLAALMTTPPLFGFIFDQTGSYAAIYYTFGGLALLVTLIVPYVRMHARDAEAPSDELAQAEAVATTG